MEIVSCQPVSHIGSAGAFRDPVKLGKEELA